MSIISNSEPENNAILSSSLYNNEDLNSGLFNIKLFNENLSGKIKYINEDFNMLGYYGIFDLINEDVFLNIIKFTSVCCSIINAFKEKLKLIDEMDNKKRCLSIELQRLEKLYGKKQQENELILLENSKLKETIKDMDKKLKAINQQLKIEQGNIRNLKISVDREKNQIQSSKCKVEKEMECLKERMNKLLSDPKRKYSEIEINSITIKRSKSAIVKKSLILENNFQTGMKEEMCVNYQLQIEDLVLENRHLREQLVLQLGQLKQLCGEGTNFHTSKGIVSNQKNNSSSSNKSSDSDISIKSNETFVFSNPTPNIDERIFLELQFDIVKDDIAQSFREYFQKFDGILKGIILPSDKNSTNKTHLCTCESTAPASNENVSRLQKEIFQLRKRITDYEDIIQGKDSLIESAIQQRIRRGSLLPET